jgi:hypothetical protein
VLTHAALLLLLSAGAAPAFARQMAPAPSARRDPDRDRIMDEQRREIQLRRRGDEAARPTDERAVKAAVKQLGEDFRRIQLVRNDVARALVGGAPLDYGRVSEQAAEVRKRALRMQSYLALRDAKGGEGRGASEPAATGEAGLKEALVRLCKRIDSFVASPRFKSPGVLDVEGDARAGRDLREIIALSDAVREGAGRLNRHDSADGRARP